MPARSVRLPPVIALFGFAGLLPPAALALGLFILPAGAAQQFAWVALVFYGALIFSFLGGTWWAFAAARPRAGWIAMAVSPSLFALLLLLLMLAPATRAASAGLLALAILVSPVADGALASARLTPGWWMRLRVPLSVGLALCVGLGALRAPLA